MRTFQDLGAGARTVRGMWGATDVYLPIPLTETPVAGTELRLIYSHSSLLDDTYSSMTVVINGEPRVDVALSPATAQRATLVVPLPTTDDQPNGQDYAAEGYYVQIQFYLRLTDELCEAENLPGQWAVIHPESEYTLVTRPRAELPGLEYADRLLTPRTTIQQLPALYVQSYAELTENAAANLSTTAQDQAGPVTDLLASQGLAAYYIGRLAAGLGIDAVITPTLSLEALSSRGLDDAQPGLIVSPSSALPSDSQWGVLSWRNGAFESAPPRPTSTLTSPVTTTVGAQVATPVATPGASPPANPQSLIALEPGAQGTNPAYLLLTGADAPGVLDAAAALVQPRTRALLRGPYAEVTGAQPATGPAMPYWGNMPLTFGELGFGAARQVRGRGEHYVDYYFERPPVWDLQPNSTLELHIAAAPGLRADTSWVEMLINGLSIGVYPLRATDSPDSHHAYVMTLPVDALNLDWGGRPDRRLSLQVRFFLDVPHAPCEDLAQDALWAAVLPTSRWNLRGDAVTELDLGRLPAPFVLARTTPMTETQLAMELAMDAVQVVLPAEPTPAEQAAGLQILAALGRWAGAEVEALPRLTTVDILASTGLTETLAQHSLILVGTAERNPLLAQVLDEQAPPVALQASDAMTETEPLTSTQTATSTSVITSAVGTTGVQLDGTERLAPIVAANAGLLHLQSSPWNEDLAVLIVTAAADANGSGPEGESDEAPPWSGLMVAARGLAIAEQFTQLRGETAWIVPGGPVQILQDTRTRTVTDGDDVSHPDGDVSADPSPSATPPAEPEAATDTPDTPDAAHEAEQDAATTEPQTPETEAAPDSPLAGPGDMPPASAGEAAAQAGPDRLGALAPWQVVGAVLLGMFVATVAILFYARVRRRVPAA